jgi:hypothetical protein
VVKSAHTQPGWLLLLLWIVVGSVSVPSARPTPTPAHDEAPRPALSRAAVEVPGVPDRDDLVGDVPLVTPALGSPEVILTTDLTHAGPPMSPGVAFALHQRPPPVVTPI